METTVSAKITRPSVSGTIQRRRLFRLLDDKTARPVIWLSSPAGAGKTKLVSSYLEAHKSSCIWYQCDEGDSDLATFFYYMGLAAKKAVPRSKKSLPLLPPDHDPAIGTFTRRYFEKLFEKLASGLSSRAGERAAFVVLDNYQDVPVGSSFHEMIANSMDMIPEGVRFIVISRSDPPTPFIRLQANDKIDFIGYSEIRFTLEESRDLLQSRIPGSDDETIRRVHERTEGWAAGIILMIEMKKLGGADSESTTDSVYGLVFDYFAGEVFEKTEKSVQDFLLKTAILPVLSGRLTGELTAEPNAGRILSALSRFNYFTERLAGGSQGYRYHPLFREFLLARAKIRFTSDELASLRKGAAVLLEQTGQIEDAARLYIHSGESAFLARMVTLNAGEFLRQGRNRNLLEWIAAITDESAYNNPWLLYWTGMSLLPLDAARARKSFQRALELFKSDDDASGIYLSWAGIVDTHVFELDEWTRLDACIAEFEELGRACPSFPSPEVDLIASSRMFTSLVLRKTDEPAWVLQWFNRVLALLRKKPSAEIEADTAIFMSLYFLWKGEYHKNAMFLESVESSMRGNMPSPFAAIRFRMMQGIHYWVTAQYDSARATLSQGLDLADKSGFHVLDSLLWSFIAAADMASGTGNAEAALRHQVTTSHESEHALCMYFHHINAAWHALLNGNPSRAAENMEVIEPGVARMGAPYYRTLWHIGTAQACFELGRHREAKNHVRTAYHISRTMKSFALEWYVLLISAYFLFMEGHDRKGLRALRRGLSLGRKYGYVHLEFYQPSVAQFLYAKALDEGIETDYVKELIGKLNLAPPKSVLHRDDWPYPLKIYTLGRFEVLRNEAPLVFVGKTQKKPLDLLKAIIVFGGKNVPVEWLTDTLWPDADGDLAHKSFEMTLSRLRKLLGREDLIQYRAGQVSINLHSCWIDSLALKYVIETSRKSTDNQAATLCEKALALHKGLFLPSDTNLQWTVHNRETLKNGVLRIISATGRYHEAAGQWKKAVEYYLKGLDTDDLAEEFYQRLMVCYQKLGNNAEAVRTYSHCRSLLRAHLGIEPSAGTEAIYSSVLGNF